jgi:hypothetical protein
MDAACLPLARAITTAHPGISSNTIAEDPHCEMEIRMGSPVVP